MSTSCCTIENNVAKFRIGFPVKDSQGNAIDQIEGAQLEVQFPGSTDFTVVGNCDFPEDTITWDLSQVPDGNYVVRARGYFYKVKGPGGCCQGSCKRFGPASPNIAVVVKEARPGAPPAPVELTDCCAPCDVPGTAPTMKVGK